MCAQVMPHNARGYIMLELKARVEASALCNRVYYKVSECATLKDAKIC